MPLTLVSSDGVRISVDDALAQRSPLLQSMREDGEDELVVQYVGADTLRTVVAFLRLFHACPLASMPRRPSTGHCVELSVPAEFLDLYPKDMGGVVELLKAALYLDVPELVKLSRALGTACQATQGL